MESEPEEAADLERMKLRPTKWVQNGFTLAHDQEGAPVFVHGALPGEDVEVEIDRVRKTHRFARTIAVDAPATERIESDCPAFPSCGGCSFRHLSYEDEVRIKRDLLTEFKHLSALLKSGQLSFRESPSDEYRHSVRLHSDGSSLGFYAPHSRTLVPLPKTGCLQLVPGLNAVVRRAAEQGDDRPDLRFLMHRDGVAREEDHKKGNIVALEAGGLLWRFPAGVFFQSNAPLLGPWLEFIQSLIPAGSPDVVELFCGTGIISGFCRERLGTVRGYDSDPRSLAAARQNFKEAQYEGRFSRLDLYAWPVSLPDTPLLICNPPRAGLKKGTIMSLGRLTKLEAIIYSSCNPSTLDRDMERLGQQGFKSVTGCVFDFFPRTPHVETVILMKRDRPG